jgi:BarA-like signal transduction histidine kinase
MIVMTGLPVQELITQIAQRGSYACLRKPHARARDTGGDVSRR